MIPLDRLAALCPPDCRHDLLLLSDAQCRRIRASIRRALCTARRRGKGERRQGRGYRVNGNPIKPGRPITSTHPRAAYWREYKRRQARKATT